MFFPFAFSTRAQYTKLGGNQIEIFAAFRHQFLVVPFLNDVALSQYHDLVGVPDGGQAMGNQNGRPAGEQDLHRFLDSKFSLGVDNRRRLI